MEIRRLKRRWALSAATAVGLAVAAIPATSSAGLDPVNLSQGMFARQSSTYPGGDAWHAADGGTDGSWGDGSVAHTNYEVNPWWEVDLGAVRQIGRVEIANRTDCCSERLVPFVLIVSDVPILNTDITDPDTTARSAVMRTVMSGPVQAGYVVPVNRSGRFVRVALLGTNYLNIAEVTVLEADNAARGRSAIQSSTHAGGEAFRAVDGSVRSTFTNGTVSATTSNEARPWWQVDLGMVHSIREVHVWSSNTSCCSVANPRPPFRVWVSNTPFTPDSTTGAQPAGTSGFPIVTGALGSAAQGDPAIVPINVTGRYVAIQLMGIDALSLAEVQVWTVSRGTVGGHAHLSSGSTEDNAMDLFTGPSKLAGTSSQDQPYWEVDLGGLRYLETVKLWNLFGTSNPYYYLFVSNTDFVDSTGVRITQISALTSKPGVSTWIGRQTTSSDSTPVTATAVMRVGRFVRIMLPGTNQLGFGEAEIVTTEGYAIASGKNNGATDASNPLSRALDVTGYFPRPSVPIDIYAFNATPGLDSGNYSFVGTATTGTSAILTPFAAAPMYGFDLAGAALPVNTWQPGGLAGLLYQARDNGGTTATPLRGVDTLGAEHVFWPDVRVASAVPTPDDSPSVSRPVYLSLPRPITNPAVYYGDNSIIPTSYAAFKTKYGYSSGVISATYYNAGDLGLGRIMRCKRQAPFTTCAVDNVATTDKDGLVIFGDPVAAASSAAHLAATVVMVVSDTNKVPLFAAYDAGGSRLTNIALDSTVGNTNIPGNCISCHSGSGVSDDRKTITRAAFLPFDLNAFLDLGTNKIANQLESFRKLNFLVFTNTSTPPAIADLILGWYAGRPSDLNQPFNSDYVPAGWSSSSAKTKVYSQVIKPYCRTCHTAQLPTEGGIDFLKADDSTNMRALVIANVCSLHRMPHAQQTMKRFWASGARAQLLGFYGRHDYDPENCTP